MSKSFSKLNTAAKSSSEPSVADLMKVIADLQAKLESKPSTSATSKQKVVEGFVKLTYQSNGVAVEFPRSKFRSARAKAAGAKWNIVDEKSGYWLFTDKAMAEAFAKSEEKYAKESEAFLKPFVVLGRDKDGKEVKRVESDGSTVAISAFKAHRQGQSDSLFYTILADIFGYTCYDSEKRMFVVKAHDWADYITNLSGIHEVYCSSLAVK